MAILKVAQMGHPVLRMPCEAVDPDLIGEPEFQQFLDDLLDTMEEYDGQGLAAPQVHTPWRVVVLVLDDDKGPEFFINPEIEVLGDATMTTWEGCLSVEGMRARVTRPSHIRVRFLDRNGSPKGYEIDGYGAVVVQHECDHLDGTLYVDRCDTRSLAFLSEYRRFGPVDEYLAQMNEEEE